MMEDAAFTANSSDKKGGQCKPRFTGTCHNYGWSGHKSSDCWEEGGGRAGQAPKGWKPHGKKSKDRKGSSSASAHVTEQSESQSNCVWFTSTDLGPESHLAHTNPSNPDIPKLYDSGALQHLLPAQERFLNFVSIPPRLIRGADNGTFDTVGRGDLPIYLQNRNTHSRILLKDVLYVPSMHVTLVSISWLAQAGC